MGISLPRVLLGGLVAGFVINLGELAVNVWLLGDAWREALAPLGLSLDVLDLMVWGLGSFVLGVVGVWIYAAAAPRYGPGARTALRAGLALWAATGLYAGIGVLGMGILPAALVVTAVLVSLVEIELGVYVGAWLYREGELAEA